jgi:hypothetical protein
LRSHGEILPFVGSGIRLQGKFQDHVNQLVPGYDVVVIGVELFEYIAAKIQTLLMQQALGKGDKLAFRNYAVIINVKDIKQLGNHLFSIHTSNCIAKTKNSQYVTVLMDESGCL